MPSLRVDLPGDSYSLTIEAGVLRRLGLIVREAAPHTRALLAVDSAIEQTHGAVAARSLEDAGFAVSTVALEACETAKSLETVEQLYDAMLGHRMERTSPVVALGGGVVGDTAGFAAATFLRGVPLVQVPSTLLAMVDASIGGKTGVNAHLPGGGLGKNLIGAFWQPRAVVIDPTLLATLPLRHVRSGLAESIKHGMIGDAGLLDVIQRHSDEMAACDPDVLTSLIERSAAVKVAIVQADERESGSRMLLNLGHTFAHAIEPIAELDLHHGEAVAIGLCAAARVGVQLELCEESYAERVQAIVAGSGLPVRLAVPVATSTLIQAMQFDKKMSDGRHRLIVPIGPGASRIIDDVPVSVIEQAWHAVGAAGG